MTCRAAVAHRSRMAMLLTTPTVMALAGMMMIAAVPHATGQTRSSNDGSSRPETPAMVVGPAVGATPGPEEAFRSRMHDEMAEWRRKMQAFDAKLETRGRRRLDAAETRLRTAWDDTEVEARNVETATDREWARTRRAYERAAHRMAAAWDKARL